MSERERESEFIEIDSDITAPGSSKQTKRTVTDRLIKKPSHEDFVVAWSETVLGKGLTFDFFSDPLVHKTIVVTRTVYSVLIPSSRSPVRKGKILFCPEGPFGQSKICLRPMIVCNMRVMTPLYKDIGACFMGDA